MFSHFFLRPKLIFFWPKVGLWPNSPSKYATAIMPQNEFNVMPNCNCEPIRGKTQWTSLTSYPEQICKSVDSVTYIKMSAAILDTHILDHIYSTIYTRPYILDHIYSTIYTRPYILDHIYSTIYTRPYILDHIYSTIYTRPYILDHIYSTIYTRPYILDHIYSTIYTRPYILDHIYSTIQIELPWGNNCRRTGIYVCCWATIVLRRAPRWRTRWVTRSCTTSWCTFCRRAPSDRFHTRALQSRACVEGRLRRRPSRTGWRCSPARSVDWRRLERAGRQSDDTGRRSRAGQSRKRDLTPANVDIQTWSETVGPEGQCELRGVITKLQNNSRNYEKCTKGTKNRSLINFVFIVLLVIDSFPNTALDIV